MPSSRGCHSSYDCIVKIKGVTTRPILFSQLMRSDGEGAMNPEELFADDRSPASERERVHEDELHSLMRSILDWAISFLSESSQGTIRAIYFEGKTVKQHSEEEYVTVYVLQRLLGPVLPGRELGMRLRRAEGGLRVLRGRADEARVRQRRGRRLPRRRGDQHRRHLRAHAAHYGFSFAFCNPRSGNEKGAVENAVGAVRRNVFVPMPRVDNLRAYNKRLLNACMGRADKGHYLKGEPERQLFEEDCASMLELLARPFRVAKVGSAKTDKYGDVCLEGRHRYPLGPEHD